MNCLTETAGELAPFLLLGVAYLLMLALAVWLVGRIDDDR